MKAVSNEPKLIICLDEEERKTVTRGLAALAIGIVTIWFSPPSHAIDCRAYQLADMKFKRAYSHFDREIKQNKEIMKDGHTIVNFKKYRSAQRESLGDALNEYADEYIRIHFQNGLPEGVAKDQALVASHDYRDLCPGRSLWGLETLDTWLTINALCLDIRQAQLGACNG